MSAPRDEWITPCDSGACVKVRFPTDGGALVASTEEPGDLFFKNEEWAAFIDAVKAGKYDL